MREAPSHGTATGPMTAVRVLALSQPVFGNIPTHILADFGAEVVKLVRPGVGDELREWRVRDLSLVWIVYARNKKRLALGLRHPKGRDVLLALARSAHMPVECFVPGTHGR